jgi:hypothetical protein
MQFEAKIAEKAQKQAFPQKENAAGLPPRGVDSPACRVSGRESGWWKADFADAPLAHNAIHPPPSTFPSLPPVVSGRGR